MAESDPYELLGVSRTASADEIRRAYRALAKKHHPDLNPGNKEAEDRFKAIGTAYDFLSDPEKRARFDRGEIDAAGQERPDRHFYRGFADADQGARQSGHGFGGGEGGFSDDDLGDILGGFFRARGGGGGGPARGRDQHYQLTVSFLDAVNGAQKRLTLPDGHTLDVTIPPGLRDGQVLRLRGKGSPGHGGGPAGDALIEVSVAEHAFFRREGDDIHAEVPVTLKEAVLGAKIAVPTPGGTVNLSVPPHSDTGARLRLRGRGVPAHGNHPAGDMFATLKVVLGKPDAALEEFLKTWEPAEPADPRRAMVEER
ncbi:MAG TPA: DnaJ C-terminal domain-containing protein [Acetobacteraceae bacterium]|nr:DnaJ C-terminal domain-containing protein [Acetobacteraceae bacterium]